MFIHFSIFVEKTFDNPWAPALAYGPALGCGNKQTDEYRL